MPSYHLLAGSLLIAGIAASPLDLAPRAPVCNRDNLLRCVLDQRYTAQASAFCSELTPATTIVATTTVTETSTEWAQVTDATLTNTIDSTTVVYTQTVPSATTTITAYYRGPAYAKRAEGKAPAPVCMTNGVAYPASRITSACSCIDVPATTLSVTLTAGTATVTETSTSFYTASETVTSVATISTQLAQGVQTVLVPHPPLKNLDFEAGTLEGWQEKKGSGGPTAFVVSVVSAPGPYGNDNKAVQIVNNLNQGYTGLETTQLLRLEPGARYRISVSAKTTAPNAGATIPKMTGYVWLRNQPWSTILSFQNGGVARGNGWYEFTFEFQLPQERGGDSYVSFDFQRFASPTSTFLDDFSISKI